MQLTPIDPSAVPALRDVEAARPDGLPRGNELEKASEELQERLGELQGRLYAEARRALLVVLQGRDASGKDGTIRHVFAACNPQGCQVTPFKAPSPLERAHDYLWRVHAACPARGMIGIFNRSHYEDVLAARVQGIVPESTWSRRYRHIAEFERMLVDEGTIVVKLFLHVSRAEQAERLESRLDEPDKNWKFQLGDLDDRARWQAYSEAYRDAFARTSTVDAPWYLVPADDKKARNHLVAQTLVDVLERANPQYPAVHEEQVAAWRRQLEAELAENRAGRD